MQLSKTYSGKFFKKHVVEKAINSWLEQHDADLLSSEFLTLDIGLGDEELSFDSFEEFLEDYSSEKTTIRLLIRLPDRAATFSLTCRFGITYVSVSSKNKRTIDSVVSIFDESNENSGYTNVSQHSDHKASIKATDPNLYKEERRQAIDLRVIKSSDLLELARQILSSDYDGESEKPEQTITLKWNDGSSWEANNLTAVSAELENARKKLSSIEIDSFSYDNKARISCRLTHENKGLGSELIVSGYGRQWVSEVYLRLTELIESFEPQKKIPVGTDFIIIVGLGALVGWTFFKVARHANSLFFPTVNGNGDENQIIGITTIALAFPLGMIIGLFGGTFLSNYIRSAYPRVELQVGPTHQRLSTKRRKLIWAAATTFGVPVLLQLLL